MKLDAKGKELFIVEADCFDKLNLRIYVVVKRTINKRGKPQWNKDLLMLLNKIKTT